MNSNFYQKIQHALCVIIAGILVLSPTFGSAQSNDRNLAQVSNNNQHLPWSKEQLGKELVDLRSRTTKQYETNNGTVKAFSAPNSLHYQDASGNWKDIDLTISNNTSNKFASHPYLNIENAFQTYYAADPFSGSVITETSEGVFYESIQSVYTVDANNQVIYNFESSSPSEVVVIGSSIVYTDVLPFTDIKYTQNSDGRKFDLVIKTEEFTALLGATSEKIVIEEKMTLPEGWVASQGDHGIDLHSQNGVWITNIPTPSALETVSSTKEYASENELKTEGEITFEQIGNELTLKTSFSTEWIKNAERVYPISLDPTINVTPTNTTFWTGRQTSTNGTKQTGFLRLTNTISSTWAKFDLSTVPPGAQAINATYHGYHYTTTGTPDKVTKIVGLGTTDPVTAANATLFGDINTNGPTFNSNYIYGGSVYQWRSGALNATGLTNIANDISTQGWTALGFAWLSGTATFQYHYGHNATGVGVPLICYLELEYALVTAENDAGVASFDSPVSPICPGTETAVVTIQNFGINQISPVTVNWTVNGAVQTPVVYTGTLDTINGTGNNTAQVTLGTFSVNAPVQIEAWTSMPNNVVDTVNNNDSVIVNLAPALSGNYIIGASGLADYPTFNAAADDLESFGICGPVVFDVEDGLYNEQVEIPQIVGAFDTNTITFRSINQDSSLVELEYPSTNAGDNYILRLSNANNIILEHLTLHNTGGIYSTVVDIVGNADSNRISNCHLYNNYSGTSTFGSVIFTGTGSNPEYNTFNNNLIEGGSYGAYYYGTSTTILARGVVFENNMFLNQYFYGASIYYLDAPIFKNNTVTSNSTYSFGYGFYAGYCDNEMLIEGNHVYTSEGTVWPRYGMYLWYNDGTAGTPGKTINNIITLGTSSTGSGEAYYGLYPYYNDFQEFTNNTITLRNGSATSRSVYTYYCDFYDFKNNLVVNYGAGVAVDYNYGTPYVLDNNAFYAATPSLAEYDGVTNITSLQDLQAASNQEANSVSTDPVFVDTVGGIHCNAIINNAGQVLPNVIDDFYNNLRTSSPDIGAVEYMPGGVISLGLDSILCQDSLLLEILEPFTSIIWNVSGNPIGNTGSYLLTTNGEAESFSINIVATTQHCGTAYASDDIILVPNISLDESAHLCPSETLELDAQGGFNSTYTWFPVNSTASSIEVSEAGIYIGQKNEFGCISTDTIIVTASQAPSIDNQEVCSSDLPIQLDATVNGGNSYNWSAGSSTNTAVNSISAGGSYTISIQDIYGCDYVHAFDLEEIDIPSPLITASVVSGNAYTFVGGSSNSAGSNATYTWSVSPGGATFVGQVFTYIFPWSNSGEASYTVSLSVANDCGEGSTTQTVTPSATGINDLDIANMVSVYPNPVNEILNVVFPASQADISMSLMDLTGRVVLSQNFNNSYILNLNVSSIASGSYMLQISSSDLGTFTKQIIVR